jgi:hypothetical protein
VINLTLGRNPGHLATKQKGLAGTMAVTDYPKVSGKNRPQSRLENRLTFQQKG